MNEQNWLMHFLSEEEMPGEETSLGDFLWANGYFDFWDEYRSYLKPTVPPLCDADGWRMYLHTLELGPLRALIAHVFRDLMRQYEQLPFPYRPFFAAAFYRLIELEAHRPTLEELWRTDCRDIPCARGIYRVMVPAGKTVRFLSSSVNPRAQLCDPSELERKYQALRMRNLLYIGQANGDDGLREHLYHYVKSGLGPGRPGRGVRSVWQMENPGQLVVETELCEDCDARARGLLRAYLQKNGAYPLANRRQ